MSSEEQRQILKMVADGKISADQAMKLIKAIEASSVEMEIIEGPSSSAGTQAGPEPGRPEASEFEKVAQQARRLWRIPLWVGVGITILSAYWLYILVDSSNFGFWFYCAWFPLLLGVALLGLFAGGRTSRWLFVKVQQAEGRDGPRNITLGLPLPLGLAGWFLRTFGHNIEGLRHTNVDEIIQLISGGISAKEPLIVNVDEGENGERVQVYIG
jgi:SHOCT-like protein